MAENKQGGVPETGAVAPKRTSDNTAIPGGGSWRWDDQGGDDGLGGWIENVIDSGPAAEPKE